MVEGTVVVQHCLGPRDGGIKRLLGSNGSHCLPMSSIESSAAVGGSSVRVERRRGGGANSRHSQVSTAGRSVERSTKGCIR